MWRRVMFSVFLWGCVADLILAQQQNSGVPLAGLFPSGQAPHSFDAGGVPLPQPADSAFAPSSVPVGAEGSGALPPVVVHVDGGVPLPPASGGGDILLDPVVVPLENEGVPLPIPSGGGFQDSRGVPLPPPYSTVDGIPGALPPSILGGSAAAGSLRHVHNPELDSTVQRVLKLDVLRDNIQHKTRADKAVKIGDVVTAHKQVVTGQLVYLTLRVGETKCSIGTRDIGPCAFDPSEDTYVCEMVVWERPWLNSSKVIDEKSRCAETEDDNDFNSWGFSTRLLQTHSPSDRVLPTLPEGVSKKQLELEAFNYVDRGSESKFKGELISSNIGEIRFDPLDNMTKVQVNVEYGFKLCLKSLDQQPDPRVCPRDTHRDHYICSVYVVHNPNQISSLDVIPIMNNDNEIHCEKRRSVEEELVVPVRAPCLGCPQSAPLNDPTIMEISDFALKEFDRTSDEDELHMISRLIKAQTQVVAGVKYYLTVELAQTDCKKTLTGIDVNRTFCNQDFTEDVKVCDLHVVDQPWVPARDLVASQCYDKDSYPFSSQDEFIVPVAVGTNFASVPFGSDFQSRTSLLGSQTPIQIDDHTLELARMVVAEYNRREDDPEYYRLVKVLEANSQEGAGTVYQLTVEMAETHCNKFDSTLGNGEHCVEDPREEHEVCRAQIHEQGSNDRRIASISCEDLDDYLREKFSPSLNSFDLMDHPFLNIPQGAQDIPGKGVSADVNDPAVQEAAAFVIGQYNLRNDEDELSVLTNVVSAHTQDAGGVTKYLLEVEAAETHCKKYLPIFDSTRCPVDHSEERKVCQAEVSVASNSAQEKHLTRLYCDDRNDYFTNKLRGNFFPGGNQHLLGGTAAGGWHPANVNDSSIQKLGYLIADEFDVRSDEDNLFIFNKIIKAEKQVTSGLKYHLVVELLETVCPKYKRRIDKTRCVTDIGEEPMICEANVLIQPWLSKQEVMNLHCAERGDFQEGDDSMEISYHRVHPSAHARPVFKSQFVVRTSDESLESNERFYHPSGRAVNRRHDTEEDDSDELPNFRNRRGLLGGAVTTDVDDPKVKEIADFAIKSMDSLSEDPHVRKVEKIHSAKKQIVAGINYYLNVTVVWTTCLKADEVEDLSTCRRDTSRNPLLCNIVVYERSWEKYRKVMEASCKPSTPENLKK
ncbi:hypothetical protein SK128_006390 [Halocaridina rubra]|uniref:Cystatin domain-containing protein n=1 Tax=Halocaridina rubra TaxID=373956 RepID=A0AAN8WIM0_HALRR